MARKKNIRVLVAAEPPVDGVEIRQISGGLLMQERDAIDAPGDDPANWTLATGEPADPATLADLVFAWRTCRAVKSNAIVIAADGATVGVGMGQVNRVDAARLAVERGGDRVRGAVAASDAFFPFPDGLETLTAAGVKAIVHPGGSMRDDVVTEAAAKAGVTLYLTGRTPLRALAFGLDDSVGSSGLHTVSAGGLLCVAGSSRPKPHGLGCWRSRRSWSRIWRFARFGPTRNCPAR